MRHANYALASLLICAALAGCGGTPPAPQPPLRSHAQDAENLGVRRHTQGDYAAAARQFATALRLHQSVDDLDAVDRNRLQLAQTLLAQQQAQAALEQAQQVRSAGARVSALLLQAQALLTLQQNSAATEALTQAQSACTSPCAEQGRIALLQARTAWARNDATQTLTLARAAAAALKDRDEAHELANAHRLAAAAALTLGDSTTALPAAQQALALDRQLALPEKIARDWLLIGDIHTRAGQASAAREAYQRALSVSQAAGLPPPCHNSAHRAGGEATMSPRFTRWVASLLLLSFVLPAHAQTSAPKPDAPATNNSNSEEVQPKFFIWGLLLDVAFKFAMSAFTEWRKTKATVDLNNPINYKQLLLNSTKAGFVSVAGGGVMGLFGFKSVGAEENTVADLPTKPIAQQNGQPNYQGAHVALLGFDRANQLTGIRPVTAGFQTGDRIKLKVLPTFDALVVIENINPQGVRRQIYPPSATEAVSLKAGTEVLLPLREDQFFEFAGVTGDEQLVITLRDPRAGGGAESKAEVSRKDEDNGSSFVQETVPGTYPVIAQSIRLKHE